MRESTAIIHRLPAHYMVLLICIVMMSCEDGGSVSPSSPVTRSPYPDFRALVGDEYFQVSIPIGEYHLSYTTTPAGTTFHQVLRVSQNSIITIWLPAGQQVEAASIEQGTITSSNQLFVEGGVSSFAMPGYGVAWQNVFTADPSITLPQLIVRGECNTAIERLDPPESAPLRPTPTPTPSPVPTVTPKPDSTATQPNPTPTPTATTTPTLTPEPAPTETPLDSCEGSKVGGYCWYYGRAGQSCTAVCASHGGYHEATRTYAGTDGNQNNCWNVLNALGIDYYTATEVWDCVSGGGCMVVNTTDGPYRVWCSTPTSEEASYPYWERACACNN